MPASLDCPLQQHCPGCPLGASPYGEGLASKGRRLLAALEPYAELAPRVREPVGADPVLAYRLRAKLVCRGRALGLFERGSHRVVDVSHCRVLSLPLAAACEALRELLPLPIHGADLRETSEGVLITLLTEERGAQAALERVARELVARGAALGVALARRREGAVRLLSGEPQLLAGVGLARHALSASAPYMYATPGGFVQAHAGQASHVYDQIERGLAKRLGGLGEASVLELFAGSGSLALRLARGGARVSAVEAYAPAIELAERAAREQGLTLRAIAADATHFLRHAGDERFDALVGNPPRRGLDLQLREAIAAAAPRALCYVSCNPQTLARDASHLQRLGLVLESAEPLDMIPWSDAVEVLCWLTPGAVPAPRVLYADTLVAAVEKAPHESLALQASGAGSLTRRLRALPGFEQATPLEAWGAGVSGVCWFARRAQDAPALARRLEGEDKALWLMARGNVRKQGTITRPSAALGTRYKKLAAAGRHSLLQVLTRDPSERAVLGDLSRIGHPVLGDARPGEATPGDTASNRFLLHRHGLDRIFVHVQRSRLAPAAAGEQPLEVRSELAPDLACVLESMGSDEPEK